MVLIVREIAEGIYLPEASKDIYRHRIPLTAPYNLELEGRNTNNGYTRPLPKERLIWTDLGEVGITVERRVSRIWLGYLLSCGS